MEERIIIQSRIVDSPLKFSKHDSFTVSFFLLFFFPSKTHRSIFRLVQGYMSQAGDKIRKKKKKLDDENVPLIHRSRISIRSHIAWERD